MKKDQVPETFIAVDGGELGRFEREVVRSMWNAVLVFRCRTNQFP